ncbi:hypothetical protein TNIN_272411 [Trichonephila inaurata madagascariensis]|uniref:Uncharacterized protein n=1 Tax=Trichonephila inaurata madagascariensis TaxID=2747483 RepID=A0A8X6X255_9ARAC|nr:hypothetical protein TNIN_272411 [Trichonephila inaurata madagascariensis]
MEFVMLYIVCMMKACIRNEKLLKCWVYPALLDYTMWRESYDKSGRPQSRCQHGSKFVRYFSERSFFKCCGFTKVRNPRVADISKSFKTKGLKCRTQPEAPF